MDPNQLDPQQLAQLKIAAAKLQAQKEKNKPVQIEDLTAKTKTANALNYSETHAKIATVKGQNAGDDPMVSDADEQLILRYAWDDIVYIKYLLIRASKGPKESDDDDEEKACPPKTLKIYANRPNLDFDDAGDIPATIKVELTAADLEKGNMKIDIAKKFARAVRSIEFFIEDNQEETERTFVNMLKVYGTFGAKLNMDELKKSG